MKSESSVYTCILQNRVKSIPLEDRDSPRWHSNDLAIKSIGNRLILDVDTDIGLHVVYCLYNLNDFTLQINRTFLLCDNQAVYIHLEPENIFLNPEENDMLQADLIWDCPLDKLHRGNKFHVTCNVTYQWPSGIKPIQFTDRLDLIELQAGFARFICFNEESQYSQIFDRKIFDEGDFHTQCIPTKTILLEQTVQTKHQLCVRELNRTEPWISAIPEEEWPSQPFDCFDPQGVLTITNGILHLTDRHVPGGQYRIVCSGTQDGTLLTLVDSTIQLVVIPKWKFFVLDSSIQPGFGFQSVTQTTMNSELLELSNVVCTLPGLPQIGQLRNGAHNYPTVTLESATFGKQSGLHVVRCETLDGLVVRETLLSVVAPNDVKLMIFGANHTIHRQGDSFSYFCQVFQPFWISSLVQPKFVPPYPTGLELYKNRAILKKNIPLGEHHLTCILDENGLYARINMTFKVVRK
ncbi:unnamed protein product [Echinostoma caproni]|uniref:Uncharacterized protein n=1 Tax=Echinostoma caproni TaxID=27848 RepID=A0A3P8L3F0_9TREM|nr:unnamed protein product [Echinostoma caproni]